MQMKLLASFILLLALQLCSPEAQVRKDGAREQKPHAEGGATQSPPASARPPVVCIDPGHPSEVASGTEVQNGTNETHVAWVVALRLQKILEAKGYAVCLTKSAEGELVRNRDRALVANRAGAALMVRLHCDASTDRGFAIYHPDRQATRDGVKGPSPRVIGESARAAAAMHDGMAEVLRGLLKDGGVRGDSQTFVGGQQGGALTGSIFSEVPVVLIEMVVLSNPEDAEFIKAEAGQQKMAEAIASGVMRFIPAPAGKN
jgi:N-acetylmuramoyl-L-alanine amidase